MAITVHHFVIFEGIFLVFISGVLTGVAIADWWSPKGLCYERRKREERNGK